MRTPRFLLALALFAAPFSAASATSYVVMGDAPLADQAELIVRARVDDRWVSDSSGRVMTHYTIMVEEIVKGAAAAAALEVRVLGGVDAAQDLFLRVWGVPQLTVDEESLLFLRPNDDGSYRVLHLLLGAFHRLELDGESYWVRRLEAAPGVQLLGDTPAAATTGRRERDAGLFVAWLRDRAAGVERQADYLRAVSDPSEFSAAFTYLAPASGNQVRWFTFDDGQRAQIKRHKKSGEVPGGAKRELKNIVKILNQVKQRSGPTDFVTASAQAATINLQAKGRTNRDSVSGCDGESKIVLSDRQEDIGDDYDCGSGGVLALGGIKCAQSFLRRFRDEFWFSATEGFVVFNDQTRCVFEQLPTAAQEVLLHEVMHFLGLGHSCGDDESPSCRKSAVLNEANMRARAHFDSVHPFSIGVDDARGLMSLYDDDPWAQVECRRWAPGEKKFCNLKRGCGPCGLGQGNCKKNKECAPGLVCTKNAGAEFGLAPGVDVCTAG